MLYELLNHPPFPCFSRCFALHFLIPLLLVFLILLATSLLSHTFLSLAKLPLGFNHYFYKNCSIVRVWEHSPCNFVDFSSFYIHLPNDTWSVTHMLYLLIPSSCVSVELHSFPMDFHQHHFHCLVFNIILMYSCHSSEWFSPLQVTLYSFSSSPPVSTLL